MLDKACESLNQAFATGDRYQARLLLRLLAALTTSNVVSMPSMLATLTHIVSTAIQVLQDSLGAGTTNSFRNPTGVYMHELSTAAYKRPSHFFELQQHIHAKQLVAHKMCVSKAAKFVNYLQNTHCSEAVNFRSGSIHGSHPCKFQAAW